MNEQNEGTNVRPAERNRPHTCLCGLAETPVKITHTEGQVFITLKHKAAAIQNATSRRQQNQTKNLKHEMYTCIIINMNGPNPCNHLVPGSFSAVHSIFPDLTVFHFFTAVRQTTMLSPSPPPPLPPPPPSCHILSLPCFCPLTTLSFAVWRTRPFLSGVRLPKCHS